MAEAFGNIRHAKLSPSETDSTISERHTTLDVLSKCRNKDTISRDNTAGNEARMADLLGKFGNKLNKKPQMPKNYNIMTKQKTNVAESRATVDPESSGDDSIDSYGTESRPHPAKSVRVRVSETGGVQISDVTNYTSETSNPYQVLGVSQNAEISEIRSAHRKLIFKLHPDKTEDPELKAQLQKEFSKVQTAYELLSDANARRHFDEKEREIDGDLAAHGYFRDQSHTINLEPNSLYSRSPPESGSEDNKTHTGY